MDRIASSIVSTYYINKMMNSGLKIPLFHTPASHFSLNRNSTMGIISEQKLVTTISFHFFVVVFLLTSYLTYLTNTISRKLPVKATFGVHLIYPKVRVWAAF